ncbi:MAG: YHYH protein [Ilumatobacter sp.]
MTRARTPHSSRVIAFGCGALLVASSCASEDSGAQDVAETTAAESTTTSDAPTAEPDDTAATGDEPAPTSISVDTATTSTEVTTESESDSSVEATADCDDVASLFVTRGSANADLADPEVAASCDGTDITVTANAIPDYTYIGTSPGSPSAQDHTYTIPATPTLADTLTDIPVIGTAAVTLGGIPIFGPTEGTGGDVDSLPGILSDCGSHNGPSGFHIHKIGTSEETDCLFPPDEVAAAPQLVGYAFDGFPIYTGNDQYTSSWSLTDETLFASDTWAAHTYIEGSGDLDECNGLTDADGNYAYYTTDTFPYVLGCYAGVVDLEGAGGGGGGGGGDDRPERVDGGGGEGAAPPAGEQQAARPERPEGDEAGGRPERPEPPEGDGQGARPEPPQVDDGGEQP